MLPNVPAFPVAYYGILRAGGVVVPMNVLLKGREVDYYLGDSGAEQVFVWDDFAEAAPDHAIIVKPGEFEASLADAERIDGLVERDDSDTAVILYTSGTTGSPKGAELTHANLGKNLRAAADLFGLEGDTVIFGGLPLFHSFGQTCALNAGIYVGRDDHAAAALRAGRGAEDHPGRRRHGLRGRADDVRRAAQPPRARELRPRPSCASARRAARRCRSSCCTASRRPSARRSSRATGSARPSPVASFNHPDKERKPGSIGTPIADVEMRVVDDDGNEVAEGEVGEIEIRGHNVMKGYWGKPDATDEVMTDDGWFSTGDMAKVDEDGYFFIVDRKKDLIIRGGYNVYPREIEEVLYEHEAVREAAVVGMPHPELGEEVGAAVATKSEVSEEELQSFVKERVAAYKYPRLIWFVDELPKGPTGKILKREIEIPGG